MSQLPDIDNSWFDDKNTLNYFKFVMSTDGVKMAEYEINQLFQGGK